MEVIEFGRWSVECDPERTRSAYARARTSCCEDCGCDSCVNFLAARDNVFPPEALELFARIGIDVTRDSEVYRTCRLENGLHDYGGWFAAVGQILTDLEPKSDELEPLGEHFSLGFSEATAKVDQAFDGLPLFLVDFAAEIPWVCDRPEPEDES